ncbi:hypothetical protein BDW67DRAFT_908 [Aspergillus spinulosporus]
MRYLVAAVPMSSLFISTLDSQQPNTLGYFMLLRRLKLSMRHSSYRLEIILLTWEPSHITDIIPRFVSVSISRSWTLSCLYGQRYHSWE